MAILRACSVTLRRLLHRISPQAFRFATFCVWYVWIYLPHITASWFIRRRPQVHGFGSGSVSHLVKQLGSINALAPTRMCRVMTRNGSDKGRRWHNYTTVYSVLFDGYRDQPLRFFELGLGTNNPELISTMGITGCPGASLRAWRELFPHALIYGADIDRAILFQEDRIRTFYCDQLEDAAIRALWSQSDLQGGVDIIIEDGLHTFEANTSFLEGSLDYLRPGGIYVIEDIASEMIDRWYHQLETVYSKRYPNYEFALVVLPHPNNHANNNLLVIRRQSRAPCFYEKPATKLRGDA
jgi:hypothetical protein